MDNSQNANKTTLNRIIETFEATYGRVLNTGEIAIIVPLAFHVGMYIDPSFSSDYKDRYCYLNNELAVKALLEYEVTGKMKYWHKHHNKSISIVGSNAYKSGDLEIPSNVIYQVDWNINELEKMYHYSNPAMNWINNL